MVHIKRIELSHFKSFGGTTQVPLLPGFTVISGPNGSGKSNILDALLFCLGLASSKGMRAERLPDLVNHDRLNNKGTNEVTVSVTFDLSDWEERYLLDDLENTPSPEEKETGGDGDDQQTTPTAKPHQKIDHLQSNEWVITRRLRVTKGGSYASNFYINGMAINVGDLHDLLRRLHVYPEGYNIVLQGDVTGIISMNGKERREIIDELAGVAEFDRKIAQVKQTLTEVHEREERFKIIEQELAKSLEKLAADRLKAEKYQKLKAQIHEKQTWEKVLLWRITQNQIAQLTNEIATGRQQLQEQQSQLETLNLTIEQTTNTLNQLNAQVKALGEEEHISLTSAIATQKLKRNQLQQRQQDLTLLLEQTTLNLQKTERDLTEYQAQFTQIEQEQEILENDTMTRLKRERSEARTQLEQTREEGTKVAAASDAWVQEQAAITKKINTIQAILNPQRTEQARKLERHQQLTAKIESQTQLLAETEIEIATITRELNQLNTSSLVTEIQTLAQQLSNLETERNLEEETKNRLLKEQREKQRQLDKLEATRQAQRELQGTYTSQLIIQSNIPGVCGLVAQLATVAPPYQVALEMAAGGRLGFIVVEDDTIAAAAIELLKQKKAGRATFLPLNKIRPPQSQPIPLRNSPGFIDYAVKLIDCEPKYRPIFAFVFGNTAVFENLNTARPHLGKTRIVTLEGDLLETTGAMTGGSQSKERSSLHFGTASLGEGEEFRDLRKRLEEIETVLTHCDQKLQQKMTLVKTISQNLTELQQQNREQQVRKEQSSKDLQRLEQQQRQLNQQLTQNNQELTELTAELTLLAQTIPIQEAELEMEQTRLDQLEREQTSQEWQKIQILLKQQEQILQEKEQEVHQSEGMLLELENQALRLQERIEMAQTRITTGHQEQQENQNKQQEIQKELTKLEEEISERENLLNQLNQRLGETKKERDRTETHLKNSQNQQQHLTWSIEKLQITQGERQETLTTLQTQLETQQGELPEPIPEIPLLVNPQAQEEGVISFDTLSAQLENLQKEIRNGQRRLEAMEPVNMLALEEYDRTNTRRQELLGRLATLEGERTELLLRIENFTTLRSRAFKEAFDAVNLNFQNIFATLSEGDGYLDLDDHENPFNGGLNLIAHPKGKPVQRLSSMSGGEKSLTALSFIFALQRYRPSPFYAFDEVDMFLDGANVERLAKMIKQQAEQAQFLVVSLRRPTIESAERTIGVTQARGAHTQVLGIKL